jgi:hypothetical protein
VDGDRGQAAGVADAVDVLRAEREGVADPRNALGRRTADAQPLLKGRGQARAIAQGWRW